MSSAFYWFTNEKWTEMGSMKTISHFVTKTWSPFSSLSSSSLNSIQVLNRRYSRRDLCLLVSNFGSKTDGRMKTMKRNFLSNSKELGKDSPESKKLIKFRVIRNRMLGCQWHECWWTQSGKGSGSHTNSEHEHGTPFRPSVCSSFHLFSGKCFNFPPSSFTRNSNVSLHLSQCV